MCKYSVVGWDFPEKLHQSEQQKDTLLGFAVPVIKSFHGPSKYLKLVGESHFLSSSVSSLFFTAQHLFLLVELEHTGTRLIEGCRCPLCSFLHWDSEISSPPLGSGAAVVLLLQLMEKWFWMFRDLVATVIQRQIYLWQEWRLFYFVLEKYLIKIQWLNYTGITKPYPRFLSFFQKEKFTSAADEAEKAQQTMQGMSTAELNKELKSYRKSMQNEGLFFHVPSNLHLVVQHLQQLCKGQDYL